MLNESLVNESMVNKSKEINTGERINGEQINGEQITGERINGESAPAPFTLLPASCSRRMENWDSTSSIQSIVYSAQQTSHNHRKRRVVTLPTPF